MSQGWQALVGPASTTSEEVTPRDPTVGPESSLPSPEAGARIAASDQGVEIWIHDLPSEAELRVLWIEGEEAGVFAGEGVRFNVEEGRLEAFSPPGAVRVEIPRSLERVVVRLDGNILLRKSGDEVEILGPVQQRTPSEIRFEAPGSPNDGRS